jgi:ribosomal protein S18 acetylase RimI-like enzyme
VYGVFVVRTASASDSRSLWALNNLPNVGQTADPKVPLKLPLPSAPPEAFPDLVDVESTFIQRGGDFVVVEDNGFLVGMGGFKPRSSAAAEILRVRVHPAVRRRGVGRRLMAELENRATARGFIEVVLDTATNQPEAVAFYRAIGYEEQGEETRPEWSWTLVYFRKSLI